MAKATQPTRPAASTARRPAAASSKPAAGATRPAAQQTRSASAAGATRGNGGGGAAAAVLRAMKERWEKSKEASKNFRSGTTAPVGTHEARLSRAQFLPEQPAVVFEFTVTDSADPAAVGEKGVRYDGLDTDERVTFFQQDLRRLGVAVDEIPVEGLEQLCADLQQTAPVVSISVKEKDGYINCYINKLLDGGGEAGAGDPFASNESGEATGGEAQQFSTPGTSGAPEEDPFAAGQGGEELPAEIQPGDDVSFMFNNKKYVGVVKKINDNGTASVREESTRKVADVPLASIELLAQVE